MNIIFKIKETISQKEHDEAISAVFEKINGDIERIFPESIKGPLACMYMVEIDDSTAALALSVIANVKGVEFSEMEPTRSLSSSVKAKARHN